jgi:hypothetical protein
MVEGNFRMNFLTICSALCLMTILCASPAMAYLDPVSGSMISQLMLGGVAGVTVVAKLYWRRFMNKIIHFQSRARTSRIL